MNIFCLIAATVGNGEFKMMYVRLKPFIIKGIGYQGVFTVIFEKDKFPIYFAPVGGNSAQVVGNTETYFLF